MVSLCLIYIVALLAIAALVLNLERNDDYYASQLSQQHPIKITCLAALPTAEYARIVTHLEPVAMPIGKIAV